MTRHKQAWGWAGLAGLLLAGSALAEDPPLTPAADPTQNLRRPLEPDKPAPATETLPEPSLLQTPVDPPLGYAGPSGILPKESQEGSHFVPVEDRWRIGISPWDRYGKGHPTNFEYPFVAGNPLNPYSQNVLKGDYPILGQHTFLNITATSLSIVEGRETPVGTTPFESTANPGQWQFFGKEGSFFATSYLRLSLDLFHGDTSFKPPDWRVKITPVFDVNNVNFNELSAVGPDPRQGTSRGRTFMALEEWFVEAKLADLGPDYDFVSTRIGSQFFNNDFRGFLYFDTNRGVRLFGTRNANREQFNLYFVDQMEKDTNSELNNIARDRNQNLIFANYYYQDFLFPGYTAQASATYNSDQPSFHFNKNNFLVRPDPDGVFQPHRLDVVYLGWAGDGHINRFNLTHQFYWALGHDSLNPIANREQIINGKFAAAELSYDRDYVRFRTSFLFASGDGNTNNGQACGFDSILDNPNFAGGQFSYWQRQALQLFSVNLVQGRSLIPDLRSSKIQGQSNFVNPGLLLGNAGFDVDLTPKLKMINNVNVLWFDKTNPLEVFVYQKSIDRFIGTDVSMGFEYRPLLNNNIITTFGISSLLPGRGFKDLYSNLNSEPNPLMAGFVQLALTY